MQPLKKSCNPWVSSGHLPAYSFHGGSGARSGVYYGSSGHSIPLVQVMPSDGQVSGSTVETPEPAQSQPRK